MGTNTIQVENVAASQLELLQSISRKTFSDTFAPDNDPDNLQKFLDTHYSTERLKAELEQEASSFYFASIHGSVYGYTKLNEDAAQTEQHGNGYIELERIYVSKESQGLGVGKALLEHAINISRAKGYLFLWLGVWEKNLSAIAFYRKHGFEVFGEHIFYVGEDAQTDLVMKLPLVH